MSLVNGLTRRRYLVIFLSALGAGVEKLFADCELGLLRDDEIYFNLFPGDH